MGSYFGTRGFGITTRQQRKAVDDSFELVANWTQKTGWPIYLGEFGTYFRADSLSRIMWTEYVTSKAETLGFSWGYWQWTDDFGVFTDSTNTPVEYLVQPLFDHGKNEEMNEIIRLDDVGAVVVDASAYLTFDDFEPSLSNLEQLTLFGERWLSVLKNDTFPEWSGKWYATPIKALMYLLKLE